MTTGPHVSNVLELLIFLTNLGDENAPAEMELEIISPNGVNIRSATLELDAVPDHENLFTLRGVGLPRCPRTCPLPPP